MHLTYPTALGIAAGVGMGMVSEAMKRVVGAPSTGALRMSFQES